LALTTGFALSLTPRHVLFIFFLEIWNKKRWIITGDNVPPKEWAFIISNHPSEVRTHANSAPLAFFLFLILLFGLLSFLQVDWMCWWPIAWRKGMVGNLKVILKKV